MSDENKIDLSSYPEYIQRMHVELQELNSKLEAGNKFLNSKESESLTGVRKQLLIAQLSCMAAYGNMLSIRLNTEIAFINKNKEETHE